MVDFEDGLKDDDEDDNDEDDDDIEDVIKDIDKLFDGEYEEEKEKEKDKDKDNNKQKESNLRKNETKIEKETNATSENINGNKTEDNQMKSKSFFSQINNLRKEKPGKFTLVLIGCIVGLIVIIVILNSIIKWCRSYKRKGYMSQIDSDVGRSNKISGASDF